MKNIVLVSIAVFIGVLSSNSQVKRGHFEIVQDEEEKYWIAELPEYEVYEIEGTPEEIYKGVELAIAELWRIPEEVIIGESENNYIKISGQIDNEHKPMQIRLMIIVKNNEFRIEYQGFKVYKKGNNSWQDTPIYFAKKNGDKRKGSEDLVERINLSIDNLIKEIKDNVDESTLSND